MKYVTQIGVVELEGRWWVAGQEKGREGAQ